LSTFFSVLRPAYFESRWLLSRFIYLLFQCPVIRSTEKPSYSLDCLPNVPLLPMSPRRDRLPVVRAPDVFFSLGAGNRVSCLGGDRFWVFSPPRLGCFRLILPCWRCSGEPFFRRLFLSSRPIKHHYHHMQVYAPPPCSPSCPPVPSLSVCTPPVFFFFGPIFLFFTHPLPHPHPLQAQATATLRLFFCVSDSCSCKLITTRIDPTLGRRGTRLLHSHHTSFTPCSFPLT